jgi:hypothetical protein
MENILESMKYRTGNSNRRIYALGIMGVDLDFVKTSRRLAEPT